MHECPRSGRRIGSASWRSGSRTHRWSSCEYLMSDQSLKSRLRGGEICKGTFLLFLVGGDVAQFLAGLGFDYFILDLEHSAFYVGPVRETIRAARAAGIAPIVRVPEVQYHVVTRVLDAG